jgi:uncharacterized protein YjbI with pentapeptide repeats
MAEFDRYQIFALLNQSHPLWLGAVDLSNANLIGANLQGAKLLLANLSGANLMGAHLGGATYTDATIWPTGFDPMAAGAIKV